MIPELDDIEIKKQDDKIQIKETRTEIHERQFTVQQLEDQKIKLQAEISRIDALLVEASKI